MRIGRFPQNAFDRLLGKAFERPPKGSRFMRTHGGATLRGDELIGTSQMLIDDLEMDVSACFYRAYAAVVASGGVPEALCVSLCAKRRDSESRVKGMLLELEGLCKCKDMEFYPTSLETLGDVRIMNCTVIGKKGETYKPVPGDTIIYIGNAGEYGRVKLLRLNRERLEKRFSKSWLKAAEQLSSRAELASVSGLGMLQPVAEGGVLAALWDMKELIGSGFEVDMLSIPIRQETVEICEQLEVNPYMLSGDGGALLVCHDGEATAAELEQMGIACAIIGTVRREKECAILKKEEKTCLDRPETDGLWQFLINNKEEDNNT